VKTRRDRRRDRSCGRSPRVFTVLGIHLHTSLLGGARGGRSALCIDGSRGVTNCFASLLVILSCDLFACIAINNAALNVPAASAGGEMIYCLILTFIVPSMQ